MTLDDFTRHLFAATVALLAVVFSCAVVWQIVNSHEVDPLLASLAGGTIAYLLPSPTQTGKVTVENDPSDPVPTSTVKAKDRGDIDVLTVALIALIVVVILVLLKVV